MKLEFPILDINEGTGGDPTSCIGTASLSNSPDKCSGICYPNIANIKAKAKGFRVLRKQEERAIRIRTKMEIKMEIKH